MHVPLLAVLFLLTTSTVIGDLPEFNDNEIIDYYSGVKTWSNFSRQYDKRRECSQPDFPLRVAYFTRHEGTMWDFVSLATHLDIPWTLVNPKPFSEHFNVHPKRTANDQGTGVEIWKNIGQLFCHAGDILMFGDLISYARPLLQGGCTTPMIMHVTNRFNYGVTHGDASYLALIGEATTWPHVWWALNNPYELFYMNMFGIKLPPERTLVLRPVGVSLLPRPAPDRVMKRTHNVAVVRNPTRPTAFDNMVLFPWLENEGLLSYVSALPMKYGGPTTLAAHRGILHIPYQVSVMKMYEGLAAGAVFILPSMALFVKLLQQHSDNNKARFCCRALFENMTDTWPEYMDWYHPEFRNAHVFFDSWDELRDIVKGEGELGSKKFFKEKRQAGRDVMAASRDKTFKGFQKIFADIKKHVCENSKGFDIFSAGVGTVVYRPAMELDGSGTQPGGPGVFAAYKRMSRGARHARAHKWV